MRSIRFLHPHDGGEHPDIRDLSALDDLPEGFTLFRVIRDRTARPWIFAFRTRVRESRRRASTGSSSVAAATSRPAVFPWTSNISL